MKFYTKDELIKEFEEITGLDTSYYKFDDDWFEHQYKQQNLGKQEIRIIDEKDILDYFYVDYNLVNEDEKDSRFLHLKDEDYLKNEILKQWEVESEKIKDYVKERFGDKDFYIIHEDEFEKDFKEWKETNAKWLTENIDDRELDYNYEPLSDLKYEFIDWCKKSGSIEEK